MDWLTRLFELLEDILVWCVIVGFIAGTLLFVGLIDYVLLSEIIKGNVNAIWGVIFIGAQAFLVFVAYNEVKRDSHD